MEIDEVGQQLDNSSPFEMEEYLDESESKSYESVVATTKIQADNFLGEMSLLEKSIRGFKGTIEPSFGSE